VIWARFKTVLAGFVLGLMVGAAGLNLAAGRHLDQAELKIRILQSQLEDRTEQLSGMEKALADLEKKLAARQRLVVSDIDVHVRYKDEYERLEIEAAVKKLLKNLMTKEVKTLDPILVTNIVDQRIIETGKHKYLLTVKETLVSEKIIMYVEAKEVKEQVL